MSDGLLCVFISVFCVCLCIHYIVSINESTDRCLRLCYYKYLNKHSSSNQESCQMLK